MSRYRPRPAEHKDRGASTVIVALLVPVLFGAAALGVDISMLAFQRQNLKNALDAAAAAGAYNLPNDPTAAQAAALSFAGANDAEATPTVEFWCIIGSTGAAQTPKLEQIPGQCDPGGVAGMRCNESICAIPCAPGPGKRCNAINVLDDKDVPFSFAPAIGFASGNTGALNSTACKGPCGTTPPNPMDVVVVADRTGSMSTANRNLMVSAIKSTLQTMNKDQQYVALATIHRTSSSPGSCPTTPSGSNSGPWVAVPFSNNYTQNPSTPGATPPLNNSSSIVTGLNCLSSSSGGTHLAAPMKASARYLLGLAPNNLGSLPVREYPATKAIIFETDGQPNETNLAGTTSLSNGNDPGTTNGAQACTNLSQVATNTKAANVLIVTVAFGDATSAQCSGGGQYVRNVLAAAASPDANGNPSVADSTCSTSAQRAAENSDGDNFFCAAGGGELGGIFETAIGQLSGSTRLIRLP